ncbi:MAG: hypothetical protein D6785_16120, partial [Planctomycetota bacterium]
PTLPIFSGKDSFLYYVRENSLEKWDLYAEQLIQSLPLRLRPMFLALSPKESLILAGKDKKMEIYDLHKKGEPLFSLLFKKPLLGAAFDPEKYRIYFWSSLQGGIFTLSDSPCQKSYLSKWKEREAENFYKKGKAFLAKGLSDQGKSLLEKSLEFQPSFEPAKRELGKLIFQDFSEKRQKIYKTLESSKPLQVSSGLFQDINNLLHTPTYDYPPLQQGIEELEQVRRALAAYQKGENLYAAGKWEEAHGYYGKSLQYFPGFKWAKIKEREAWERLSKNQEDLKTSLQASSKPKIPSVASKSKGSEKKISKRNPKLGPKKSTKEVVISKTRNSQESSIASKMTGTEKKAISTSSLNKRIEFQKNDKKPIKKVSM